MIRTFGELVAAARAQGPVPLVVAAAANSAVLKSVAHAMNSGIVDNPVLTGDPAEIEEISASVELDLARCRIVSAHSTQDAVSEAVRTIQELGNGLLMKGLVGTGELLRAVLNKESGLRRNQLLSHVGLFQVDHYDRLFFLTDGGINISPDLSQKAAIAQNAILVAHALGISTPKVAALAALELVNPSMPATVDAACLAKMAERGQITGALVDGPLALDNAISMEAAQVKHIKSPVAGQADVLLVPDIETGNVVYKSLVYFGKYETAGIVAGAKVPIVLTSRSDSERAKLNSIALGALMITHGREEQP